MPSYICETVLRICNIVVSCLALVCIQACHDNKGDDGRTAVQLAKFIRTNDSILGLGSQAISICDSMMAMAPDSQTYYDYYILKGRYYLLSSKPDSAPVFAKQTLAFADKQPTTQRTMGLKAFAYSTEASYYHLLRQKPHEVIRLNTLAYEQILKSDLNYYAPEITANLADAYISVDDLPAGAKWYRRALFLVDSLDLPGDKKITLYMGLGQIYTSMHDYTSARLYYEMSEHQFDKMKPNMQSYFLNNYGNYFYFTQDYDNALSTFRRLKKHLVDIGSKNTSDMALCQINMADIFLNKDMTDSAMAYVEKAAKFFEDNNVNSGIYYANTIKLGIAIKQRKYNTVKHILKSEDIVDEYSQTLKNIRSKYLRYYYAQTGDYKLAYAELLRNMNQNDSLEHNRKHMKAAEIMMRYTEDTLKLHYQIEINEKVAEVNKSRATIWLFVSIALGLTSIIVSGLITYRKRKMQARMEIQTLRLNNARQRISPHFVFNVLNASIGQSALQKEDALLKLTKLLRASLDMTSKPCVTLREEISFVTEFIELESSILGEGFELNLDLPNEELQSKVMLPSMFIQILVENAIKHGLMRKKGHKRLEVKIKCTDTMTDIQVTDNGPGFDIRVNDNGRSKNGLSIIRHTTAIINHENICAKKIKFAICNLEDGSGNVCGCMSTLKIPRTIKFI